jgi:uncharacterized protein YgiM (DUF1202 family)
MFLSRVTATLRYLTSIGLGFAVTALSVMFLLEAPGSAKAHATSSAAVIKSAAKVSALPRLKASDFDIARAVPVVVQGKIEPKTVAAIPQPDAAAPVNAAPGRGQAMVIADAVNVRSGPSKGSTKLSVVRSGQVVDVIESDGGWSRIVGPGGEAGWIATKFLQR